MKSLLLLLGPLSALAICVGVTQAQERKPDAQMQAVLDAMQSLEPKPIEQLRPAIARNQPSVADGVIQLLQDRGDIEPEKLPAVGRVEMKIISGAAGQPLMLRVYTPRGNGPFPVIVYFHGGGWVIANLDTYDASCRALCDMADAVVVSVDYRRAPEHKFPAAHEDCYTALQYVLAHPQAFDGQPKQVAVVGESAGGNMATAVCLMGKQCGGAMPIAQILIYPVTNYAFDTPSYQANANAKPLNAAMMHWFFNYYLNSPADGENILISPLRATPEQLRGLPPATIVTAELDPLQSEGISFATKLRSAGVDVQSKNYDGVTHEFFGTGRVVDQAKAAEEFVAGRLKDAFKAHGS